MPRVLLNDNERGRNMAGRLDRKVAVITGGVSGIGLSTVELFVAEGAQVVVADIQDEKGRLLEQRYPENLRYVRCDVTSEDDIMQAMATAAGAFGGLDVLVNNAGICDQMMDLTQIDAAQWDRVFSILVRGPMLGMKHGALLMEARGGGSIINTASVAGLQAGWGPMAYSSAKAAVIHMSRAAAAQLGSRKIRVNAICPGMIATPIFGASAGLSRPAADQLAARVAELCVHAQPIPRAGSPDDIARAALYLASDDAAFVTGTHMVVDGGLIASARHAWDPAVPSPLAGLFGEPL